MNNKSGSKLIFGAEAIYQKQMLEQAMAENLWLVECFREGKLKWETLWHNLCTVEGRNYLLNAGFKDGTKLTSWYLLLFEDNYTPLVGDTYAVPGFTETTAYTETTRPAWQSGTVANAEVSNTANKATFTFNATKNIYGGALISYNVKDDQAQAGAKMYGAGKFDTFKPVESGDVIKITTKVALTVPI